MSDFEVVATEDQREQFKGVKIVRVTATIVFEAYAITEGFPGGKTLEARVVEQIADAVGYRAVGGTETEDGDALIAMTSYADFAVDVPSIEVAVLKRQADIDHVAEMAASTTDSW